MTIVQFINSPNSAGWLLVALAVLFVSGRSSGPSESEMRRAIADAIHNAKMRGDLPR